MPVVVLARREGGLTIALIFHAAYKVDGDCANETAGDAEGGEQLKAQEGRADREIHRAKEYPLE